MITQVEILRSYRKFIEDKSKKQDVIEFGLRVDEQLFDLCHEINSGCYKHGDYERFILYDGKKREIHKAHVRDRVVHQLIYDYLSTFYDKSFYFHSYAARPGKGNHKAIAAFRRVAYKASLGFKNDAFIIKLDVKKFFANVNKAKLFQLIKIKVTDNQYLQLIEKIIFSYRPDLKIGIPLGNLTSQIFANIYLNQLDYFIKYKLKIKYYIRYMDDLVLVADNNNKLTVYTESIKDFLKLELNLDLHDNYRVQKITHGIDFIGYVISPYYQVLRPKTKRRMLRQVNERNISSYLGLLSHCHSYDLRQKVIALVSEPVNLLEY